MSLEQQLDREQLIHAMDAAILSDRVIKPFAQNADTYSSGVTNAAYVIMERNYAPAQQRLTALIAREKAMVGALAEARKNLVNPPKIFTEIAIEQIDGNIKFFKDDVPAAFKDVTDTATLAEFKQSNDGVMKALARLQDLPAARSAAEVQRQLRARRRHVRESAFGERDGGRPARPVAADR